MQSRRAFITNSIALASMASYASTLAQGLAAGDRRVISVADFGATAASTDVTSAVQAAIRALPAKGGILVFPNGNYLFSSESGTAMRFTGLEDLTIVGNQSSFYFKGKTLPFVFENCSTLHLGDFTIDWQRPPFSQGDIVSVANDLRSAVVRLDRRFPLKGGEPVGAFAIYDRHDKLPARNGLDNYGAVESTTIVADRMLQLKFKYPLRGLTPGNAMVLRHEVYGTNAINLLGCKNISITNVTIHTAPGMGIRAARCSNISLDHIQIVPRPNDDVMMSTTADAIHIRRCSGKVELHQCTIWGMGDDGVNIHSDYFRMTKSLGPTTATFFRWPPGSAVDQRDLPEAGTRTTFLSRDLQLLGEAHVRSAQADPLMTLEFDRNIPPEVREGALITFPDDDPEFHVNSCHFLGNRARAILVHNRALIENCTFRGQTMAAILLMVDTHWLEGPLTHQVTIRNNIIEDVDRANRANGDIWIDTLLADEDVQAQTSSRYTTKPASGYLNGDIEIAGNVFRNSRTVAIALGSAEDVRISHNRFERLAGCAVSLRSTRNITINANVCAPAANICADDGSIAGAKITNNTGLTLKKA